MQGRATAPGIIPHANSFSHIDLQGMDLKHARPPKWKETKGGGGKSEGGEGGREKEHRRGEEQPELPGKEDEKLSARFRRYRRQRKRLWLDVDVQLAGWGGGG